MRKASKKIIVYTCTEYDCSYYKEVMAHERLELIEIQEKKKQ